MAAFMAAATPFLLGMAKKWMNDLMGNARRAQVTEFVLTDFGDPFPYRLQFVAQYRFVHQIGEFLVRRDPYQRIVGGAADSWTISPDRRSIRFHLRKGGYTAEEIAQSLRRLLRSGQTTHSNLAAQTDETSILVDATDSLTIKTRGDAGAVLSPLVMSDAVLLPDSHWLGPDRVDWSKSRGPYVYKSGSFPVKPGESVVFAPNPDHYLYEPGQLDWRIQVVAPESVQSLTALDALLASAPGFATLRYWPRNPIYRESRPSLQYFETKPNGVAYILPNQHSPVFASREARQELLRKITQAKIPLPNPELRAYQIAQPGLSGRMTDAEQQALLAGISALKPHHFEKPIRWAVPTGSHEDAEWMKSVIETTGLASEVVAKTVYPSAKEWQEGKLDATFLGVGMSDTDPISGATFLFARSGSDADLPDGSILKLLNGAKDSTERDKVTQTVRDAFSKALREGAIIPLHYIVNRHYYSNGVELNIQDKFSESIDIRTVRLRD